MNEHGFEVLDDPNETVQQLEENQIDLYGDGSVLKKVLQEGISNEQPTTGCVVSVHYRGTREDGTKIDIDRYEPFEFELNKGKLLSMNLNKNGFKSQSPFI